MMHDQPLSTDCISTRLADFLTDEDLAQEMLERARRRRLLTQAEVSAEVAARLDGRRGSRGRLAQDVGVHDSVLSNVLTGRKPLGEALARKLGFRRVIRFERIS